MMCRLILVVICLAMPAIGAEPFAWQTATPESQGLSSAKLDAMRDGLAKHGTADLLVIRHDKIVYEWFGPGFGTGKQHFIASMSKAVIGAMSLAVAMQDGRIKPDDLAAKYIAQWRDDPRKSKITIAQLASHTSGLDDASADNIGHDKLPGWKGEFWKREPTDPFTLSRDTVPVIYPPGERVSYSNPGLAMLGYAVTVAIQPGAQKDLRSLLRERVYGLIGIDEKDYSIGYGKPSRVEGMDLYANWGGGSFTPRAVARIGRLMLRQGDWDGRRILDASVVHACVTPSPEIELAARGREVGPTPAFGWWSNQPGRMKSVPRDTYIGAGAGHQLLIVIPSLAIIIVRNGTKLSEDEDDTWPSAERLLMGPVVAAVGDK